MKIRALGREGPTVSALGLGCMGMSFAYGDSDDAESIRTLQRAFELGVTLFDTAEMYGPFVNEELVGKALKPIRDQVVIATKFGFRILPTGQGRERFAGLDSRPEHVREAVAGSLRRLGIETIDLLYQHRVDPQVPIEDTVGAMAGLVREGKVRHLGLSECSVATLRRAQAVHPIAAVQSEYSLWSREPEDGMLAACAELGVGFVAYSPLGRGFLTGKIESHDSLASNDWRRGHPRFQDDAIRSNALLVDALKALAVGRGCTPAQLALAWLLAQGEHIVAIPGARKTTHLEENVAAADIALTEGEKAAIAAALPKESVVGKRYDEAGLRSVDR